MDDVLSLFAIATDDKFNPEFGAAEIGNPVC